MKRLFLIAVTALFLFGCGQAARDSGFYTHDSLYQDWDHAKFSWWGYKHITEKDAKESKEEGWWGTSQDYKPKK